MGQEQSAEHVAKIQRRLQIRLYSAEANDAAIRGELVPHALGLEVTRRCVIRGIRYNDNFGEELNGIPDGPEFTRALNARYIMSNKIPAMKELAEYPYCIWHPDVPSKTTLRRLVRKYPKMKYQVGRACAVAGYDKLYSHLGLEPDVSIAEEARDNGSDHIFKMIMDCRHQYAVMNDCLRTVNLDNPKEHISHLNGDTAVRSTLDAKQAHRRPAGRDQLGFEPRYFDIAEDASIDIHDTPLESWAVEDAHPFLYSRLPDNLPPIDKDILIVVAAFLGEVDRYDRLHRAVLVPQELDCIIRGIYHNLFFAMYWSTANKDRLKVDELLAIERAITARFIMTNDLSRITEDTHPAELPINIWYPEVAWAETYLELLKRRKDMAEQVARACIVADFEEVFGEALNSLLDLGLAPDPSLPSLVDVNDIPASLAVLLHESEASPNAFYAQKLEERILAAEGLREKVDAVRASLSG